MKSNENTVWVGNFSTCENIEAEFDLHPHDSVIYKDWEVLFADYDCPPYEGSAFVILRDPEGNLQEAHGSHCSCMGLEGQWSPEVTDVEALKMRYEYNHNEAFKRFVDSL